MTTSHNSASSRRRQEASTLQLLSSCRLGYIEILIQSLPSRRRPSTSPRVRSRPLPVFVRSEISVCTWSLSLTCRRSYSRPRTASAAVSASAASGCCTHVCLDTLASSMHYKERSLLVTVAFVSPSSTSDPVSSTHSVNVTLWES
jgi:hypothetical protein